MKIQTKAGFKKEILAFTRTKKFIILLCVFAALGLMGPPLLIGAGAMMDAMSEMAGQDIAGTAEIVEEVTNYASNGPASAIGDISQIGVLVFLLVINSFAGGEQKKRSTIIPQTSGLRSFSYIFPKFIVYPLAVFAMSVIAVLGASATAIMLFKTNDIVWSQVLLGGALAGVYLMMYTSLHLALGTATGKAGMSSAILIAMSMFLPSLFALIGAPQVYNPFSLNVIAANSIHGNAPAGDIIPTVIVTLLIMIIAFFVALFAQNAKKIDNSGNEMLI